MIATAGRLNRSGDALPNPGNSRLWVPDKRRRAFRDDTGWEPSAAL